MYIYVLVWIVLLVYMPGLERGTNDEIKIKGHPFDMRSDVVNIDQVIKLLGCGMLLNQGSSQTGLQLNFNSTWTGRDEEMVVDKKEEGNDL